MAGQQKLFAELMHEAKAGVASRPAKTNEVYGVDYKHLCLREAKHYNCRTIGCSRVEACGNNTDVAETCYNCVTGIVFQSDMSCCGDNHDHDSNHDYYAAANTISTGGTGFNSPYLRIGTCDWDITIAQDWGCIFSPLTPGCPDNPVIDRRQGFNLGASYAIRIGSATATCYLTSGAEFCDDMLCDKMVLRFQGGFYLSGAQSFYQQALDQTSQELGLNDVWCGGSLYSAYNASGTEDTTKPFTGAALLASGTVSLASMRKEVEYPVGHMDYVYDFVQMSQTQLTSMLGISDGDYPFLTPNTYKLKLVGEKKATYKK